MENKEFFKNVENIRFYSPVHNDIREHLKIEQICAQIWSCQNASILKLAFKNRLKCQLRVCIRRCARACVSMYAKIHMPVHVYSRRAVLFAVNDKIHRLDAISRLPLVSVSDQNSKHLHATAIYLTRLRCFHSKQSQ